MGGIPWSSQVGRHSDCHWKYFRATLVAFLARSDRERLVKWDWWVMGRDKYMRWVILIPFTKKKVKKIHDFLKQLEDKDSMLLGISIFEIHSEICFAFCLVHYFHFRALSQSTQETSFLLFYLPQRVLPALLRRTCSPPPGSTPNPAPPHHSLGGSVSLCQIFSLLCKKFSKFHLLWGIFLEYWKRVI